MKLVIIILINFIGFIISDFCFAKEISLSVETEGKWIAWQSRITLESLAGKQIARNVPVKTKTDYDESFINTPYKLFAYDEYLMTLEKEDTGRISLNRELWDDGNWKEWKSTEQTICYWNRVRDEVYVGTETFRMETYKPPSTFYNSNHKLSQWDHVYINFNRLEIRGTWMECGQILIFYNIESELCYNHAIVRLCNKNNQSKYRRDTITYQKTEWLEKTTKHVWQSEFYYPAHREYINSVMDDYTLDGKYKDSQVQRLFPITTKSVIYNLDKLFSKKKEKEN